MEDWELRIPCINSEDLLYHRTRNRSKEIFTQKYMGGGESAPKSATHKAQVRTQTLKRARGSVLICSNSMGLVLDIKFGVWVQEKKSGKQEHRHKSVGDCLYETAYSFWGIRFAELLRSIEIACDLHEHEAIFLGGLSQKKSVWVVEKNEDINLH